MIIVMGEALRERSFGLKFQMSNVCFPLKPAVTEFDPLRT
jgi:hypothetical protein